MVELIATQKEILIFKTNINLALEQEVRTILSEFEEISAIDFDFEDCDHILRIEAESDISSNVTKVLYAYGYLCDELP